MVPVEERLRSALVDLVDDVMVDSEEPLARVRRRRTRALATVWGGCAAAVVTLALGAAGLLLPTPTTAPPTGPPAAQQSEAPARLFPVGTYTREVTAHEVISAGFARGEVRDLFAGGDRATLVMTLRTRPDGDTDLSGWQLWFVDADGERRIRDGGGYYVTSGGEVSLVSQWKDCLGCTYYYGWDLEGRRLSLDPSSRTVPRPMARLLQGGRWEKQP